MAHTSESKWLSERRKLSLESSTSIPLPRRGLALWRYTDPATFEKFGAASEGTITAAERVTPNAELLNTRKLTGMAYDFAGREIQTALTDEAKSKGVLLMSLAQAIETHKTLVEPYLYGLVNERFGKFEAGNGAHWIDGIFLHVPNNVICSLPIQLLREVGPAGSTQYPRLLVVVGKNSEVTIVDEYYGGASDAEKSANSNAVAELFGATDSRVRYVVLQRTNEGVNSYLTHRASVGNNGSMITVPLAFGGNIAKQNLGVILNGAGANSKMVGALFGTHYQHFDNHTLHHHAVGQTRSDIDFKVVLKDKSLSAYTGLIRIEKNAKVCEAYQENRNLLLNAGTKAETIPELEILNEDVSCTHGATVGPIDPLQMFYLQCRGIDKKEAVKIIVSGYIGSTFDVLPEDIQDRIAGYVEERIGAL